MKNDVRVDILRVLKRAQQAIRKKDSTALKKISDMTIHNASAYQDVDSISIAVLMYTLYKMCTRCFSQERPLDGTDYRDYLDQTKTQMKKAYVALKKEQYVEYNEAIKKIFDYIKKVDKKFGLYVNEVLNQSL